MTPTTEFIDKGVTAMDAVSSSGTHQRKRESLTQTLIKELSDRIDRNIYRVGERMPSERELCAEFGVSRTVVREAVASIRLSGRLVSKQGVGIFVAEEIGPSVELGLVFDGHHRAALHIMELRIGIEVEAAGLAAERRSAQDLTEIVQAFDKLNHDQDSMQAAVQADFAFHLAIARASNNPHFPHLLQSTIRDVMFDLTLKRGGKTDAERRAYEIRTTGEHDAIMMAIMRSDSGAARNAMYKHLSDSINRYRKASNLPN